MKARCKTGKPCNNQSLLLVKSSVLMHRNGNDATHDREELLVVPLLLTVLNVFVPKYMRHKIHSNSGRPSYENPIAYSKIVSQVKQPGKKVLITRLESRGFTERATTMTTGRVHRSLFVSDASLAPWGKLWPDIDSCSSVSIKDRYGSIKATWHHEDETSHVGSGCCVVQLGSMRTTSTTNAL